MSIAANLSTNLTYHGKVTISMASNSGKIISKKVYNNAGTKALAKFLCYCLAGNYNIIDNERPFKIGLFYNTATSPAEASTGEMISVSPVYISINKVADVSSVLDATSGSSINYKTILHFLIPYSYISVPANKPEANSINQICLYSKAISHPAASNTADNRYKNYSASFLLSKNDGKEWDPIKFNSVNNSSYNLIIDWEMSFDVEA